MREKTIKAVLTKKFTAWVDSIKDQEVREMVEKNTVITGGALVSLIQNEKPNDYDLYFTDKKTTKAVAEYYCDQFNDAHGTIKTKISTITKAIVIDGEDLERRGEKIFVYNDRLSAHLGGKVFAAGSSEAEKYSGMTRMLVNTGKDRIKIFVSSDGVAGDSDVLVDEADLSVDQLIEDADEIPADELEVPDPYRPVFLSTNAITLSGGVQIVIRFYGSPEEIHENYDYVHTKAYWLSDTKEVVIPAEVYEAVINKVMIYTGSLYPICSLFRMRKFIKRGWSINAGQVLKMSFQISKLNLEDIDVLEDQLIGVDSLYFSMLVGQLRSQCEKPDFKLSNSYVVSLIDKIF